MGNGPRANHVGKSRLWKWFLELDLDGRARVLSVEDKATVRLIQKMHEQKLAEGEGLFFAVDDGFEDSLEEQFPHSAATLHKSRHLFKDDFCFHKLTHLGEHRMISYPEFLLAPDAELEKALRLCDTREYLDTMSVATSLLRDPYRFLHLMERASRGSFLTQPCRVEYSSKARQWVWQAPTWFTGMGYYTLGTFICHKLEQALWMRFFEAHSLDPRVPNSRRRYQFPSSNSQALLSKTHLTQFWMGTEPLSRLQIVGSLGHVVGTALRDSDMESVPESSLVPSPSFNSALQKLQATQQGSSSDPAFLHADIRLLSALVDFSMEKKAIEFLFTDKSEVDERTFIEVLYFSPLRTAGTPINFVLRRLGFIIQKAYTEKTSLDLILGEESEKKKKRNGGRKGKGRNAKKQKKMFKRKMAATAAPAPVSKKKKRQVQAQAPPPSSTSASSPLPSATASSTEETKKETPSPTESTSPMAATAAASTVPGSSCAPYKASESVEIASKKKVKPSAALSSSCPMGQSKADDGPANLLSHRSRKHKSLTSMIPKTPLQAHPFPLVAEEKKLEPIPPPHEEEDDDQNSWSEVRVKKRRKKKKTPAPSNSAPVSPRSAKDHRARRRHCRRQSSETGKDRVITPPRVTRSNSEEMSDAAKELRQRSLSSPMMSPIVEDAIQACLQSAEPPRTTNKNTNPSHFSPQTRRLRAPHLTSSTTIAASLPSSLSHTMSDSEMPFFDQQRTRSSSPSSTGRGGHNHNASRRSRSASARSRAPMRKKPHCPSSSITSDPWKRQRETTECATPNRTRYYRPARLRAKMHALHTHDEEHDNAEALDREIAAYVAFLKGVVRSNHARLVDKIVQRVRCSVGRWWSSAEIKVYGSIATGLCIPESDLDLVVNVPDNGGGSPVHLLAGELKGQVWVERLQAIYTAKVPVIKLVTENLPVDITFDVRSVNPANSYAHTDLDHHNSSHTGLATCGYITRLKKDYPALEPLVLILKQYLYCVMLNSTFTGGLASYSLVLMVASYLKFYGKGNHNLGTLLLGFFELYGKLLDYERVGISLIEPEGFFARDETCYVDYGPVQLLIIDPLCPTNNVASNTFALYKVKQAFANGYNTLTERFASPFYPLLLSRILPIVMSNGFQPVPG